MNIKILFTLAFAIIATLCQSQVFTDLSEECGFDITGFNRGIAIGDFNNDGLDDIYVSRLEGANLLYKNLGNFQFEEVAGQYGVNSTKNTNTGIWFDVDNDGDLDLFLVNFMQANQLFRNDQDTFVNVTAQYGVGSTGNAKTANAADYDNDGDLDLYVTQFFAQNILWRNNDGKSFTNVTNQSGINDTGRSLGAIFVDYDLDGDQDIYQTRDGDDPNLFFRNNGNGTFSEISESLGLDFVGFGMGTDVADLNSDGLPDLYLTNLEENLLYVSSPGGPFQEIGASAGVDDIGMSWSCFFFDCNNNGLQDLYMANDSYFGVNGQAQVRNRMYVNQGDLTFYSEDVTQGVQNEFGTYGAAYSDFDLDGKLDMAMANHGPNDGNQIFRNTGATGNYISIDLRGTKSNSYGIGCRVELYMEDNVQTDFVNAGSGYASQNAPRAHFGLGDATLVDSVVVYWPSGTRQSLVSPPVNQRITIQETALIIQEGQVVWTEPPFPTQFDDVTVYYNAAEGNGALMGFEGDVYAHTGVITSASANGNDWKHVVGNWGTADSRVLMTREGEDIYSISYNIDEFYNINNGEEVLKMAFVFRNTDGSIVGRDTDGSDIFTDVYESEGLFLSLISPRNDDLIIKGDSILVSILANKPARVSITDNEELIYSDSTDNIEFHYTPQEEGIHTFRVVGNAGDDTVNIILFYGVVSDQQVYADPPPGTREGINYTDSSYIFKLTAPGKQFCFFLYPEIQFRPESDYLMNHTTDSTGFWIELNRELFNTDSSNAYVYMMNDAKVADPYSEVVLDPFNDQWIDEDVLAELPNYPKLADGVIVTAFDKEKIPFEWEANDYNLPKNEDLVIYELLIRDFVQAHNYETLIDTLDYLEELGVNAIELMPIQEFEGNISWGYNPSFHMAVDKFYGSRNALRRFIDEAHKRDIAVIFDVVFNHVFSQSPLARMYWDPVQSRPAEDNPWLNPTPRHPFNVGYDCNHESQYTKAWVKRVLEHWITEYRVDGFRFDLSKGFTQRFTTDDAGMRRYDAGRISTLKDYADFCWSLNPDTYVILEHFAENSEETELANYGMMLWSSNRQFAEAAMGYSSRLASADYNYHGWDKPHLVANLETHDEERNVYRILNYGDREGDYDTRELPTALKRVEAISAVLFSLPGPKMIWQFGELGYDFSINHCTDGSINDACRLDPKPIRWIYLEDFRRKRLYDVTSALTHLKTNYPTFSTDDYIFEDGNLFIKKVKLFHPDMDAVVLANFRVVESNFVPGFPYEGMWYDYLSGDSVLVDDLNERFYFDPGEYHIYLSKSITPPKGIITSTLEPGLIETLSFYPNPVSSLAEIIIPWNQNDQVRQGYLADMLGRTYTLSIENSGGQLTIANTAELPPGQYFLRLETDEAAYLARVTIISD